MTRSGINVTYRQACQRDAARQARTRRGKSKLSYVVIYRLDLAEPVSP